MKRIIAIFSFLIPLMVAFPAHATSGGISGVYEYDSERINGVEVDLYKIADYDGSRFIFKEEYPEVNISTMTNSELGEYGQELAEIVQVPDSMTQTANGEYAFTGIDEGVYLVTFKDIKIGNYSYSALPIVLTMPDANLNYQIALTTKLEKSCPDCVEPEPEPTPPDEDNSNTRDKINLYIRIFIVLILLETLTLFVIIKERKREDSDEEK